MMIWGCELRELPSLAKDIRIQGLEMPRKCKQKDIFMRLERVEVGCRGPALGVCSGCLDAGLLLRFEKRSET